MEIRGAVPSPRESACACQGERHSPGLRSPVHGRANLYSTGGLCLREPRPQPVYRLLPLRIGPDP